MRLVTRLRDRLQSFLFRDVLGNHLAHILEMIAARIEHPEARQRPRDEMVMQCLIAAQRPQRQFPFAKGEKKRMLLRVPALADCQYPIGDRKTVVACHCCYLPERDRLRSITAEANTSPHRRPRSWRCGASGSFRLPCRQGA